MDFCYILTITGAKPLKEWLSVQRGDAFKQENYGLSKVDHVHNIYYIYNNEETYDYKGIIGKDSNELRLSSIPKEAIIGFDVLYYNSEGYSEYCKDYKDYWDWMANRNEVRYASVETHGKGYDCYLDSETEFLTNDGWKKYSEVTNEKLATLDSNKNLIYQDYQDRVLEPFKGTIYTYENRYTRFSVTGNHNLYISDTHRNIKNNFSLDYIENKSNWHFQNVNNYFKERQSYKHIMVSCNNDRKDFKMSDDTIQIIGAYLSDGTLLFKNDKVKSIRISQLEHRPLSGLMENITEYKVKKYFSKTTCGGDNYVYDISDKYLKEYIYSECGHGSLTKKLPKIVSEFSGRQVDLLLNAMIDGDGHKHKKGHTIYYSANKKLIEALQLLLFNNGKATQIYSYISKSNNSFRTKDLDMYQLYIPKIDKQFINISKNTIEKRFIKEDSIVCFTVPNSILITRNNNKIAIQGNSKNLMHCFRLLDMGINAAKTGALEVVSKNRDWLLQVRAGEFEYDDLITQAEEKLEEFEVAIESCALPTKVDINKVNDLLLTIREEQEYFKSKKG